MHSLLIATIHRSRLTFVLFTIQTHTHIYIYIYVYIHTLYLHNYVYIKHRLVHLCIDNISYHTCVMPIQHQYEACVGDSWPLWHPQDHVQTWYLFKFCNLSSSLKFATLAKLCETCSVQGTTWASKLSQSINRKIYFNVFECIWYISYYLIFLYMLDYFGMHFKSIVVWTSLQTLISTLDRAGRTDSSPSWTIQKFQTSSTLLSAKPLDHA